MKILLLLNGPEGWQTGIEDGYSFLKEVGEIEDFKCLYLHNLATNEGSVIAFEKAISVATEFQPTMIVIFHIGHIPLTDSFIAQVRNLPTKPILVYDEGDMYGSFAKPLTKPMKRILKAADVVSIRGLGEFREKISKFNSKIIYTPHHADIARYDVDPHILKERKQELVFIGNKNKPRFGGSIRRLPGAREREAFVRHIGNHFPDKFHLYGNGWNGFSGNQGPVGFADQLEVYKNSWITVSYEHYPNIPYYFSNRLPIALLAGSLYVSHYHEGYENMFRGRDFIFFFKSIEESVDIIKYVLSLDNDERIARAYRARAYSLKYLHPTVVWKNFHQNVLNIL